LSRFQTHFSNPKIVNQTVSYHDYSINLLYIIVKTIEI